MDKELVAALINMQAAVLDVCIPELRAISISKKDPWNFTTYFYYSGCISEEIIDLWSSAVTEASAGLGADYSIDETFIRIDLPKRIPVIGFYVFLQDQELIDQEHVFPSNLHEVNTVSLRLATLNALLGCIPQEIKGIIVDIFENRPRVWVYYDREMGEGIVQKINQRLEEVSVKLPLGRSLEIQWQLVNKTEKIIGPQTLTAWYVYLRYEHDLFT